jgi:hypothetical protein
VKKLLTWNLPFYGEGKKKKISFLWKEKIKVLSLSHSLSHIYIYFFYNHFTFNQLNMTCSKLKFVRACERINEREWERVKYIIEWSFKFFSCTNVLILILYNKEWAHICVVFNLSQPFFHSLTHSFIILFI